MTTTTHTLVSGSTDRSFSGVVDAFTELLQDERETGAALAVTVDGRTVVDLWGGFRDLNRTREWQRSTAACVFSAGKGPLALAVHMLAAHGRLRIDAPVAHYWPEFAAAGKHEVTTRELLEHSAGLPAVIADLPAGSLFDWDVMTQALAAQAPWWTPGERHGYHLTTFGWLVGEVVRRATGLSPTQALRQQLAGPLKAHVQYGTEGLDETDVAELTRPVPVAGSDDNGTVLPPTAALLRAMTNPPDMLQPGLERSAAWRSAQIPASNTYATAGGLARIYAVLAGDGAVDGIRLLPGDAVADAIEERRNGDDAVLGVPSRFASGFMLPSSLRPFGRNPRVAGHSGTGGALAFADLDARLSFAFVPARQLTSGLGGDPRWPALLDATYAAF